jgi:hypothetical protein
MLLRASFQSAWRHFSWLLLAHWFFVTLIIVHYFVLNGLHQEEIKKLNLIKDQYSLVVTKADKRKGSIFLSTSDYFLKLSDLVPEVDAYLEASPIEMNFSYRSATKILNVKRELPLNFIGAGFFDAFKGRFIQGRGFTRSEVFSGKPMVVLTEGALIKIFGDYNSSPAMIWINGIEYQVIGTWAFNTPDILENESIFLPIGLSQLFGKQNVTYINNFILKGEDSRVLTKLKLAIDKIQMDSGSNPIRPEFAFQTPKLSKKNEFIFAHNKVYVDVFIWLVFIMYLLISLKQNRDWLSFKQHWSVWSFMAKGHTQDHAEEATDFYFMVLTLSLAGGFVSSMVLLIFLKYLAKISLSMGLILHPSLFFYILSFPIQIYLLKQWSKKMIFNP